MRIIPVIDLKSGQVVHAVGGRRDEYRPIRSRLVDSSRPEVVAQTFRERLGLHELYVADLDAIAGGAPAWSVLRALAAMGLGLMVDSGVSDASAARTMQSVGVREVIVGLETLGRLEAIAEIVQSVGPAAVRFSLDLKNGRPLRCLSGEQSPESIVDDVVRSGVSRVMVLDLARVGERGGTGTEDLCRRVLAAHPHLDLVAGGGIRDNADLERLESIGVSGALVATALHESRIRPPFCHGHGRTSYVAN
jgi:phosphoribosylformimino-5-aminoimidazole carboxamide ribotide isomerase